jgi:hypothetical protein
MQALIAASMLAAVFVANSVAMTVLLSICILGI